MQRLNETYKVGNRVEIQFSADTEKNWYAGEVVGFDPPGIWVELDIGRRFFVTNTRRIRLCETA